MLLGPCSQTIKLISPAPVEAATGCNYAQMCPTIVGEGVETWLTAGSPVLAPGHPNNTVFQIQL